MRNIHQPILRLRVVRSGPRRRKGLMEPVTTRHVLERNRNQAIVRMTVPTEVSFRCDRTDLAEVENQRTSDPMQLAAPGE